MAKLVLAVKIKWKMNSKEDKSKIPIFGLHQKIYITNLKSIELNSSDKFHKNKSNQIEVQNEEHKLKTKQVLLVSKSKLYKYSILIKYAIKTITINLI